MRITANTIQAKSSFDKFPMLKLLVHIETSVAQQPNANSK